MSMHSSLKPKRGPRFKSHEGQQRAKERKLRKRCGSDSPTPEEEKKRLAREILEQAEKGMGQWIELIFKDGQFYEK